MMALINTHHFRSWLRQTHSLSDRLAAMAGEASLRVLNHGWVNGITGEQFWQRDICISAQGEPCWYARTVACERTYRACQDFFEQLKTKSLGQLIYDSPIVQRISLIHYPIGRAAAEFQWLPEEVQEQCSSALWLRASNFRLQSNGSGLTFCDLSTTSNNATGALKSQSLDERHEPYLFHLTEIFLPVMQRYCECIG